MASLTFLGAAGTVTGSRYVVEHAGFRLMVDCGLFQGLKELRLRNWSPLPIPPAKIDLVVLTHAHLDHSGYLPLLVRNGFNGPVLATPATCDLCGILLPDSGHLQEEDARFANKHGFSKHRPALPLYSEKEALQCLGRLRPVPFGKTVEVHERVSICFRRAGHILGAAHVEVRLRGTGGGEADKVVCFSGDLGRPDQPMLPRPEPLEPCDHLLVESTYGNRDHPQIDAKAKIEQLVRETAAAGGTLVIPAFAVGRAQTVLYLLRELQQEGRLPQDLPIHVDSPMAIHAIRILMEHRDAQDVEMRAKVDRGEDPLGLNHVHLDSSVEQSKALNHLVYPAIIISAAGMATGGRVLHHLAYRLPDARNTVLFVGFQAAGTRGRALADGAQEVKIHGRYVRVRARIETLDALSAHADRGEILAWLGSGRPAPGLVHVVHGEPEASRALGERIGERLKLPVHLPDYLGRVEL